MLAVSNPTRIIIGNPSVLDVSEAGKKEVTLNPKAVGMTTLVIWDNFGEQSYQVKVVAENMDEIKRRIDNLLAKLELPSVYTQAEDEEGKVVLLGTVKNPSRPRKNQHCLMWPLKEKAIDLVEVREEEAVVEIGGSVVRT